MVFINNLTLEEYLNLPNKVLEISESKNNLYLSLLSKETCKKYYYRDLKLDLKKYFQKFNNIKFFYSFNDTIKASHCNSNIYQKSLKTDRISKFVEDKINNEIYAKKMYDRIINLAHKLTPREGRYFVEAFLANKSDEYISEKIGLTRMGLQQIRKSCLVKMYFEFFYEY